MTKIIDITNRVYSGGTPDTRKSEYWNGSIKWLSSGETRNNFIYDTDKKITELGVTNSSTKLANKGSIVMACAGQGFTRGQTAYLMNNMYINQSVICIEPNGEKVDGLYLYYFFKNNYQLLRNLSDDHSSRGSITTTMIKDLEINFPNIETQKKISTILNNIDKKIELNDEINNNLRELCKTNYLRLIENNSIELSLSDLMDYQGGSQPPASEFQKEKSEDNIRFVQIRDFETDSYVCYIPNSKKNKLCNKDDILIARYGASLGRICYGLSGAYNVALAKVLPKKEEYKELLRVILEIDDFYNYINQVGQRSAQAGFNAGDIAGYTVIMPDEKGLEEFNSISKKAIDKRLLIIDENKKLSELRDTLLPKLMNGEIDLDNIEI